MLVVVLVALPFGDVAVRLKRIYIVVVGDAHNAAFDHDIPSVARGMGKFPVPAPPMDDLRVDVLDKNADRAILRISATVSKVPLNLRIRRPYFCNDFQSRQQTPLWAARHTTSGRPSQFGTAYVGEPPNRRIGTDHRGMQRSPLIDINIPI